MKKYLSSTATSSIKKKKHLLSFLLQDNFILKLHNFQQIMSFVCAVNKFIKIEECLYRKLRNLDYLIKVNLIWEP